MMRQIYVIGSMSMDLVVSSQVVPEQGETVLGEDFFTTPGGKVRTKLLRQHVSVNKCI